MSFSVARAQLLVRPHDSVTGTLTVPGDKSISHRYAMLASVARGTTTIAGLAPGADVAATLACLRALGVTITGSGTDIQVEGRGRLGLRAPASALDAANSGTTMRLLAGLIAGHPLRAVLTGDESLARRPMRRVIEPLTAMGARITAANDRAPIEISGGGLHAIEWTTPVPSAQIKSAVLLAGLHAEGVTVVRESMATRDHTERACAAFGIALEAMDTGCAIAGGQEGTAPAGPLRVPGDPSSAAVWAAAAAALPGSRVTIEGVALNPHRVGFLAALERMGAEVRLDPTGEGAGEPTGRIFVSHATHREAQIGASEVPGLIDELPVLAARAALGGGLRVTGAAELRVKESDRITALVTGLRAMGVLADELLDGFAIDGSRRPTGGEVDAAGDHRLVMAFALAALGASGPTMIHGADCVAVSYPAFAADLARLARGEA